MDDPREAARGSHVLVTATMAPAPFVTAEWLEPGMLILSVSSFDPSLDAIEAADLLVTDDFAHETYHPSRPLARAEAAGLVTEADVVALGAILAGAHPGRTSSGRENPGLARRARDRGRRLGDGRLPAGDRAGRGGSATPVGGADLDVTEGRD